jgi:hypothetical protein
MTLKLRFEDAEDLKVISAHLQDALVRVGDIAYLARKHRLALSLNRFCWETVPARVAGHDAYQRVIAGLHFDGVLGVKARGFDCTDTEALLCLLAIEPKLDAEGAGRVEFVFAGGASLLLNVECLDGALTDLGEPWLTDLRPAHEDAAPSVAGGR